MGTEALKPSVSHPGNPYKKQCRDIKMILAQSGKARRIYGIERIVLVALSAFLMLLPTMFLRWLAGLRGLHARKVAIEVYAVAKPTILLVVLCCGGWSYRFAPVLASICLIDLYSYLLGIVLLRGFWSRPFSYTRSLILLGINLVEFVLGFAIIYLYFGAITYDGAVVASWPDAVYFSLVTTTSIGYGDIAPLPGVGRSVAIFQIFAALGFLAIILAYFVGNIENERKPVR